MTPTRQIMEALDRGQRFRLQRAALRREIESGEANASGVLEEKIPDWLRGEPIGRFLTWVPRIGPREARKMLDRLDWRISEIRRVGDLTYRQRTVLIRDLRKRGK